MCDSKAKATHFDEGCVFIDDYKGNRLLSRLISSWVNMAWSLSISIEIISDELSPDDDWIKSYPFSWSSQLLVVCSKPKLDYLLLLGHIIGYLNEAQMIYQYLMFVLIQRRILCVVCIVVIFFIMIAEAITGQVINAHKEFLNEKPEDNKRPYHLYKQ